MKIAVLADVHSNLAALEVVTAHLESWGPDQVVVAGDIVNRGPQPAECLAFIQNKMRENGWQALRGNHEDFVLLASDGYHDKLTDWERSIYAHSGWTYDQLGDQADYFRKWPDQVECEVPGDEVFRCVHASMVNNRSGIYDRMNDQQMLELIQPPPTVLCVGHTHVPFTRKLEKTLVVNVGSVGLPFDRDVRACYAQLTRSEQGWEAELVRLDYDRESTSRAYHETGYAEEGGPMIALIMNELQNARPRLRQWHDHYEPRVAGGEITIEESVQLQLKEHP